MKSTSILAATAAAVSICALTTASGKVARYGMPIDRLGSFGRDGYVPAFPGRRSYRAQVRAARRNRNVAKRGGAR